MYMNTLERLRGMKFVRKCIVCGKKYKGDFRNRYICPSCRNIAKKLNGEL